MNDRVGAPLHQPYCVGSSPATALTTPIFVARSTSNCPSEDCQQEEPSSARCFSVRTPVVDAEVAWQCVYLKVHISGLPRDTYVYLPKTLLKTTDLRQTRIGYIRSSNDLVITPRLNSRAWRRPETNAKRGRKSWITIRCQTNSE